MSLTAITRKISPNINACELTHVSRDPIDVEAARAQHEAYETLLTRLGCRVRSLPAEPDLPDSVFVEDTAVVLDEAAVITRPGAGTRRLETDSIARALQEDRELLCIEEPGTLDGGDVLLIDKTLFVGLSSRSNASGIEQLREFLAPFGYRVLEAKVNGCLHLKTAATLCAPDTVLMNPEWLDPHLFGAMRIIEVDPREPFAANVLLVNQTVVAASSFPRTRQRLEEAGLFVAALDLSELAKAEGAVTCCSLVYREK